jgi:hypothetical protein
MEGLDSCARTTVHSVSRRAETARFAGVPRRHLQNLEVRRCGTPQGRARHSIAWPPGSNFANGLGLRLRSAGMPISRDRTAAIHLFVPRSRHGLRMDPASKNRSNKAKAGTPTKSDATITWKLKVLAMTSSSGGSVRR